MIVLQLHVMPNTRFQVAFDDVINHTIVMNPSNGQQLKVVPDSMDDILAPHAKIRSQIVPPLSPICALEIAGSEDPPKAVSEPPARA